MRLPSYKLLLAIIALVAAGALIYTYFLRPETIYYENCAAAQKASKTPIYAGQPGYRQALDRDNDKAACE